MDIKAIIKGMLLNVFANHKRNPQRYWNLRWRLGYETEPDEKILEMQRRWRNETEGLMRECDCSSVLDVGCGKAWLRTLPGYLGLDSSTAVFKRNGLSHYLIADASEGVPLPDKSFDAAVSFCFLMHLPPKKAAAAAKEMKRVARWLIVLKEETEPKSTNYHCFVHDYGELFKGFGGSLVMLEW